MARAEPVLVANIADEETDPLVAAVQLRHLPLLHFVAGEDRPAGAGCTWRRVIGTNVWPNDPVPPVSRMEEPVSIGAASFGGLRTASLGLRAGVPASQAR